jgi:hypothetical protein
MVAVGTIVAGGISVGWPGTVVAIGVAVVVGMATDSVGAAVVAWGVATSLFPQAASSKRLVKRINNRFSSMCSSIGQIRYGFDLLQKDSYPFL